MAATESTECDRSSRRHPPAGATKTSSSPSRVINAMIGSGLPWAPGQTPTDRISWDPPNGSGRSPGPAVALLQMRAPGHTQGGCLSPPRSSDGGAPGPGPWRRVGESRPLAPCTPRSHGSVGTDGSPRTQRWPAWHTHGASSARTLADGHSQAAVGPGSSLGAGLPGAGRRSAPPPPPTQARAVTGRGPTRPTAQLSVECFMVPISDHGWPYVTSPPRAPVRPANDTKNDVWVRPHSRHTNGLNPGRIQSSADPCPRPCRSSGQGGEGVHARTRTHTGARTPGSGHTPGQLLASPGPAPSPT